jgi:MFS family permease
VALGAIFFANGAGFSSWVARIPAVQSKLGLGEGELGVALFGAAIGLMLAVPATGLLVLRRGSRWVTTASALAYSLVLPLIALAPSLFTLMGALAVLGATNGALDLAMNAQAVVVEKRYGRPIMTSFHALFSAGGIAGAGLGALAAAADLPPAHHFTAAAVVLALVAVVATRLLLPDLVAAAPAVPITARPRGALVGLGVLAFCVLMSEGAMADWSAVYLRSSVGTSPGVAAVGFAAFSAAMTAGRTFGDRLTLRLGPVAVVRIGGAIAAAGLGAGLLADSVAVAIGAFACVGLGLSSLFPLVLSASGRTPGWQPAVALAAATTAGYTGFLVGPPLIGLLAELTSLSVGLGLIVACCAVATILAPVVRRAEGAPTI